MDDTGNDDDFTFCQVSDQDNGAPKSLPDVSGMSLKDEKKSSGTIWDDNSKSNATSEKLEKVGSLSFKVIDASSQKKSTEPPKQERVAVGSSVSTSQGPKTAVKKQTSRAKVPFQIGYSHMDWLKITRTHPDLAGVDMLMKAVGKDCTALFNKYHAWVNAEFMLEKCLVGILEESRQ